MALFYFIIGSSMLYFDLCFALIELVMGSSIFLYQVYQIFNLSDHQIQGLRLHESSDEPWPTHPWNCLLSIDLSDLSDLS